jgi:type IV secretion system protein VirD4
MTAGRGLYLGQFFDPKTERYGERQVYEDERHAIVFGPTGTGKTTRFLMVDLLSDCLNDRSVIVIDPKGELAAVTAKHRHQLPGHDVKILDPFGRLRDAVKDRPHVYRYLIENGLTESVGFNPLAILDPNSASFYDDAAAIGEALIKIEGKDPHWTESAQGLVVGLIMWERLRNGCEANLENVRALLTEPDRYEDVRDADGNAYRQLANGLRSTAINMIAEGGYEIGSLASRFKRENDEIASIVSAGDTQTRWLLSPLMRADLRKEPGINFAQLKAKPTTVYVILPAERMRTHSVWLRLVIVSALRALYRPGGLRTVLLIDEMAALGHLGPLEDAFGLVRGYRIQIAGFLQDLGQLKSLYQDRWESFLGNAGVVQGLAPNDLFTAEWMSRRSGQATFAVKSISRNLAKPPHEADETESESWQQVARARFLPHELFGMPKGTGLLWLANLADSVKFSAPAYYEMRDLNARALPNPYVGS